MMKISSFLLILCSLSVQHLFSPASANVQTYIVHVKSTPTTQVSSSSLSSESNVRAWHRSFLPARDAAVTTSTESDDDVDDPRMVYSYRNALSGFAARLTESELEAVRSRDGFVKAYPDRTYAVQSTHSPAFLGLSRSPEGFWNASGFGDGVIIGLLDTGILPSHPSFGGRGMPPPPPKWKGACDFFNASECNNKLIGARVFVRGALGSRTLTPVDESGHGTHTAGTAGGRPVEGASVLDNALGTAVGIAPMSHLAMYRVCSTGSRCLASDILAGFDAAIADGVDVLSVSLASRTEDPAFDDPISVGALAAVEKGIFVSCGAGNDGPEESSVWNDAPWVMTVGASTTDRRIETAVRLGSGVELVGKSLFQSNGSAPAMLPLVYPGALAPGSAFCSKSSFDDDDVDVRGKIVLCDDGGDVGFLAKGTNVKNAGGVGMVLANTELEAFSIFADPHKLPTVAVTFADALKIKAYVGEEARNATAMFVPRGAVFGKGPAAPMVADFSSRGPSLVSKGILKPDVVGPGVDVLAAWPLLPVGPSSAGSTFNVLSGTSMATPHLSGVAALLKSAHPGWSPAVIRSAIMTTAYTANAAGEPIADETLRPASAFAVGAGHVDPAKANSPGLVYDIEPEDYVRYMCSVPFTDEQVSFAARREVDCSSVRKMSDAELNYPSFSATLGPENNYTRTVTRTVTNVGEPGSSYAVEVVQPPGAVVTVTPRKLDFATVAGKSVATFSVEFSQSGGGGGGGNAADGVHYSAEGSLTWLSSERPIAARSPIVITFR